VRAHWNGKLLISKHGTKIECPSWFVEDFPTDVSLDGELWLGRGTFEIMNRVWKSRDSFEWKMVQYMVFDYPSSQDHYETRIRELARLRLPSYVQVIDVVRCTGNNHLRRYFEDITELGGEGMMVNQPCSTYLSTRVRTLLKVKVNENITLLNLTAAS
jgi:DNA ligase-1